MPADGTETKQERENKDDVPMITVLKVEHLVRYWCAVLATDWKMQPGHFEVKPWCSYHP